MSILEGSLQQEIHKPKSNNQFEFSFDQNNSLSKLKEDTV
jgi:hypothetical protein